MRRYSFAMIYCIFGFSCSLSSFNGMMPVEIDKPDSSIHIRNENDYKKYQLGNNSSLSSNNNVNLNSDKYISKIDSKKGGKIVKNGMTENNNSTNTVDIPKNDKSKSILINSTNNNNKDASHNKKNDLSLLNTINIKIPIAEQRDLGTPILNTTNITSRLIRSSMDTELVLEPNNKQPYHINASDAISNAANDPIVQNNDDEILLQDSDLDNNRKDDPVATMQEIPTPSCWDNIVKCFNYCLSKPKKSHNFYVKEQVNKQ